MQKTNKKNKQKQNKNKKNQTSFTEFGRLIQITESCHKIVHPTSEPGHSCSDNS